MAVIITAWAIFPSFGRYLSVDAPLDQDGTSHLEAALRYQKGERDPYPKYKLMTS